MLYGIGVANTSGEGARPPGCVQLGVRGFASGAFTPFAFVLVR